MNVQYSNVMVPLVTVTSPVKLTLRTVCVALNVAPRRVVNAAKFGNPSAAARPTVAAVTCWPWATADDRATALASAQVHII